jgi:hypothetical protein
MGHARFLPCPFQFIIHDSMLCSPKYRKFSHINRQLPKTQKAVNRTAGQPCCVKSECLHSHANNYTPTKSKRDRVPRLSINILIFRTEIIFLEIVELPAESTVLAGVAYNLAIYSELIHRTTRVDNYKQLMELHIDRADWGWHPTRTPVVSFAI